MGNLQLEIPEFGVLSEIVGVSADWDVTWLGNSVGYLPGTAFPTWSGNTAIAGHVYLKDGMPGPFNRIGELMWGDEINIQAYGFRHKYEVREVATVQPTDLSVLGHEEYDWLTLITCRGYDEDSDTYRWRVVVRAVLMEVEPISDA
jgi:LPXTG-site transpeptidase (sortase) family protein